MSFAHNERSLFVDERLAMTDQALHDGEFSTAAALMNAALAVAPSDPLVLHASGRMWELADDPQEALRQWVHALAIDPNQALSWAAVGTTLARGESLQRPQLVALLAFAQAHRADPEWLLPAWHLALLYHALGFADASRAALARLSTLVRAFGHHPKNVGTVNLHNRAYMHLSCGQWAEGFACYEHRLDDVGNTMNPRSVTRVPAGIPRYLGGPLPNTLAVFVEQGAGDMFMILQYVETLTRAGVRVLLEAFPSMRDVVDDRMSPDTWDLLEVFPQDAPLPFSADAYVWGMSLPGLLGVPTNPKPTLIRKFRRPDAVRNVAFCWQGSRSHKSDKIRSIDPALFEPVAAAVRACGLVPVALNPGEVRPHFLEAPDVDITTFADSADVLDTCVGVVSIDSALVHLAGSMGVPTWACLAALPDWRWGLVGRGNVDWYSSVRLVRQPIIGEWGPVLDTVAAELLEAHQGKHDAR